MNSIGNKINDDKLAMSLDDIISREPLRYAAPSTSRPQVGVKAMTEPQQVGKRPKLYGRLHHASNNQGNYRKNPYANQNGRHNGRGFQRNFVGQRRGSGAQRGGKIQMQNPQMKIKKESKRSPYSFNSFVYNGVHVTEESALLNRENGDIEIMHYSTPSPGESSDDVDDEPNAFAGPSGGSEPPVRRYHDLEYVRRPVHQRLGWGVRWGQWSAFNPFHIKRGHHQSAANQFRKSRVGVAANFLRSKQLARAIKTEHVIEQAGPSGTGQGRNLMFHRQIGNETRRKLVTNRMLKTNQYQMKKNIAFIHNRRNQLRAGDEVTIKFTNDLAVQPMQMMASPTGPRGIQNQGSPLMFNGSRNDLIVAPLSRQNVAQLPGGRMMNINASSLITSVSRPSKRTHRQSSQQRQLDEIKDTLSVVSEAVNKLAHPNLAMSGSMSMVNGYIPVGNGAMSMVNGGMPMIGGGMQSFVPLITNGPGTSQQLYLGDQPNAAFQGHIVVSNQDGSVSMQPIIDWQVGPTHRRSRQLQLAANMQQLDQQVQDNIASLQANLTSNGQNRFSSEVFNYRPRTHVTSCSVTERIGHLPRQVKQERMGKHRRQM